MVGYAKRLRQHLKEAKLEAWKRKAETAISQTVDLARKSLAERLTPPVYLIDNSALANGITHRNVWLSSGEMSWGGEIPINTGCLSRVPIYRDDSTEPSFLESTFLTGLSQLAHSGAIRLVTSSELFSEMLRQPRRRFIGRNYGDHNLFNGLKIPSIDGYVFEPKPSQAAQSNRLDEDNNVRYRIFRDILRNGGAGTKISFDAWHLYTVEKHNLDGFITMDRTLVRSLSRFTEDSDIGSLAQKIILPSMLAQQLGLKPLLPRYFTYRGDYLFANHNFSAEEIEETVSFPKNEKRKATMPISKIIKIKDIRGGEATPEMEAVNISFETAEGNIEEMTMSMGNAIFLLSIIKGIQIKLDIPFPDDPTDPGSPAIRPSERA